MIGIVQQPAFQLKTGLIALFGEKGLVKVAFQQPVSSANWCLNFSSSASVKSLDSISWPIYPLKVSYFPN
jgi:hypothetical protein